MRARRVATPDELERAVARYGPRGAARALRRYGLIAPIAGAAGIAVDPSTPAATVGAATNPFSSATFTPPAGGLALVGVSSAGNTFASNPVSSISDGTNTYTTIASTFNGADDAAGLWCFYYAASPGAITLSVSFSTTPTFGCFVSVIVLTGAASSQTTGATASQTGAGQTPSVAVTTTAAGSWVFAQECNDSVSTAPTIPSGQTDTFNAHAMFGTASGNGYWTQATTAPTPASGTVVTINDTAPTGVRIAMVAAEILAAPTIAAGPSQFPHRAPRA